MVYETRNKLYSEKKIRRKITARAQMLPAGTTEFGLLKLAMGADSSILFIALGKNKEILQF